MKQIVIYTIYKPLSLIREYSCSPDIAQKLSNIGYKVKAKIVKTL